MTNMIGLVGFGEAGRTFAVAGNWADAARVFDAQTDSSGDAARMRARYAEAGVIGCDSLAQAVDSATLILSLVTADQALNVATAVAGRIAHGACYCDMNSVAPHTKRSAAAAIEAGGGHYIDVAVMAPVEPSRLAVPLLLSGHAAPAAAHLLGELGFTNRGVVGPGVGRASAIKMIRSVMVKGIEALSAECVLAAHAAGVLDEVLASLDASEKPRPWENRADYNLDRMMVHGRRRAAEMEEVVKTLDDLATGSAMARATAQRQRGIGLLGLADPARGLDAKLRQLNDGRAQATWA